LNKNIKNLVFAGLMATGAIWSNGAVAQVTVFQHCNFKGNAASLPSGSHDLRSLNARGAKNDDISAIRVAPGYVATIYEHAGFRGRSRRITSSQACLVNLNFNDIVSSVRVTRQQTTRPSPNRPPRVAPSNAIVTMYEHCNFRGNQTGLFSGSYDLSTLTGRGMRNDSVSAIRVKPGYVATVYEHAGYRGKSRRITGSSSCLVNVGFNDNISSVRVARLQTTRPRPTPPPVSSGGGSRSEIARLREELRKERAENQRLRNTIRSLLGDQN